MREKRGDGRGEKDTRTWERKAVNERERENKKRSVQGERINEHERGNETKE